MCVTGDMEQLRIGLQGFDVKSINSATLPQPPFPSFSPSLYLPPHSPSLPPSLPFLQPAWFLMVGGDQSFRLALTEKDEFFNKLREDCEVRVMEQSGVEREGRGGVEGRGIPVSEVVSPLYSNSVCIGMEVSCKQS